MSGEEFYWDEESVDFDSGPFCTGCWADPADCRAFGHCKRCAECDEVVLSDEGRSMECGCDG